MNTSDKFRDQRIDGHVSRSSPEEDVSVFNFENSASVGDLSKLRHNESPYDLRGDPRFVPRFVSIGSQRGGALENFVHSTFGDVSIHPLATENVRGLSTQLGEYSVIVALFDDMLRAKRVLRDLRRFVDTKLCYAIMTESTPQTRAALMRFAFDDVFDTRMKPAEILLRMNSQWTRQTQYNLASQSADRFQAFCNENIDGRINALQIPLLRQLYDSLGKVVRYNDLAAYDFHSGEFRTGSLTVRIHHLRRKLKNYEIRCETGIGYALVKIGS